jgi:hypothetical protein
MPIQSGDTLLAFKHIALSAQLSGAEKQFGTFLIDSYNQRTGRCDPSEETAAVILGKSKRTIIRAGNRLAALRLFTKRKHAGHNHCNSYQPNWEMFRELERAYHQRRKTHRNRFDRPKLSPLDCQGGHLSGDKAVTQTFPKNNFQLTCLDGVPNQKRTAGKRVGLSSESSSATASSSCNPTHQFRKHSWSSQQAAEAAAVRRWNKDLSDRFGFADTYALIVDALHPQLQKEATDAELSSKGGGISLILEKLAFLLSPAGGLSVLIP